MTHRVHVYPHNDLFNLAHYHRSVINQKVVDGVSDGIALDCMSCLIAIAFSTEALINFVGCRKIGDWRERRPFGEKLEQVCAAADLAVDRTVNPLRILWEIKEIRDQIAHGQPFDLNTRATTREELRAAMESPWDRNLTPNYVNEAYAQAKGFERDLFTNCQIPVGTTLTSAVGVASAD